MTKHEQLSKVLLDNRLQSVKNKLKQIRKTRQLSQSDIAKALGISRQAVSGFESGKYTPSLEMALKIAQILETTVEEIFTKQEKNTMQTVIEKFTQWLPKGERFTEKAINAIAFAQKQATLAKKSEVEPIHLLYGLLQDSTTTAGGLLKNYGLSLSLDDTEKINASVIDRLSPESKYVLELALQLSRLKKRKYIATEQLLLALIQLTYLGENDLTDLFQRYEVDIKSLQTELAEAI